MIHAAIDDLAQGRPLSENARAGLVELVQHRARGHNILEIKLWRSDGTLAYSSRDVPSKTHSRHTMDLATSLAGRDVSHFEEAYDFERTAKSDIGAVFNVYAPLHARSTGQRVGVAEFYQDAEILSRELTIARQHSWLLTGSLTAGMLALLFGIVHRGSTLILTQRTALETKVAEQERLLQKNGRLQNKLTRAHQHSQLISDKLLRRIGADLHDGPAQLLGLALIRLHELAPSTASSPEAREQSLDAVRSATQEALMEIRNISTGLSLPQLEKLTTRETLLLAVANHERRTKTKVDVTIDDLPELSLSIRTCLFRAVQEGLNNAYRHASGQGQSVRAEGESEMIRIEIQDSGPGFSYSNVPPGDDSLGLAGLEHRVQSLGGRLCVGSQLGKGTKLYVSLPVVSTI